MNVLVNFILNSKFSLTDNGPVIQSPELIICVLMMARGPLSNQSPSQFIHKLQSNSRLVQLSEFPPYRKLLNISKYLST